MLGECELFETKGLNMRIKDLKERLWYGKWMGFYLQYINSNGQKCNRFTFKGLESLQALPLAEKAVVKLELWKPEVDDTVIIIADEFHVRQVVTITKIKPVINPKSIDGLMYYYKGQFSEGTTWLQYFEPLLTRFISKKQY